MASHSILINNDLYNEIKQYCDLNGLKPSVLCNDLLKKALNELKYGDIPFGVIGNEHTNEQKNEQINEQINETLPNENLVIDIHKIPTTPTANEIIPVQPMSEPKVLEILAKIEQSKKATTSEEKKPEEENKITKTKKVRVLK